MPSSPSSATQELVAYILEARRSGRSEAAVLAAQMLAFRYEPRIRAFVRTRLGSKGEIVTDEVAGRTFSDAIASIANFEGESVPEFGGWIFRIAKNRIVDYHRKGRVDQTPLEIRTEEGEWRERDIETGDPTEVVDRGDVINQALGRAERETPGRRHPGSVSPRLAQGSRRIRQPSFCGQN